MTFIPYAPARVVSFQRILGFIPRSPLDSLSTKKGKMQQKASGSWLLQRFLLRRDHFIRPEKLKQGLR